jgi:hypothetical protein
MALFGRSTPQDEAKAQAYGAWLSRRNPLAIVSLVLGVFSLTHLGTLILDSLAGLVLGAIALKQLATPSPTQSTQPFGHRLAWTGIATSVASLVVAAILYTLPHSR